MGSSSVGKGISRVVVVMVVMVMVVMPNCLGLAKGEKNVMVVGNVYCDQCLQHKLTKNAIFLQGVSISIKCKDQEGYKLKTIIATTNEKGYFQAKLQGDHANSTCYAYTQSSPNLDCNVMGLNMKKPLDFKLSYSNGNNLTYSLGYFTFLPLNIPSFCQQTTSDDHFKEPHLMGYSRVSLNRPTPRVDKSSFYETSLPISPIEKSSMHESNSPIHLIYKKNPKSPLDGPKPPLDGPKPPKPPLDGPKPPKQPLYGPKPPKPPLDGPKTPKPPLYESKPPKPPLYGPKAPKPPLYGPKPPKLTLNGPKPPKPPLDGSNPPEPLLDGPEPLKELNSIIKKRKLHGSKPHINVPLVREKIPLMPTIKKPSMNVSNPSKSQEWNIHLPPLFRPKRPLCGPKIPNHPKPTMDGPKPPKPPLDGPKPPKPPLDGPKPPKPPLDGPKPPKPSLDGPKPPKPPLDGPKPPKPPLDGPKPPKPLLDGPKPLEGLNSLIKKRKLQGTKPHINAVAPVHEKIPLMPTIKKPSMNVSNSSKSQEWNIHLPPLFQLKRPLCGPKIPNRPKPPMDGPKPPLDGPKPPKPPLYGPKPPKPPLDGPKSPKPPLDGPKPPKPPLDGPKPPKPPLDGPKPPKPLLDGPKPLKDLISLIKKRKLHGTKLHINATLVHEKIPLIPTIKKPLMNVSDPSKSQKWNIQLPPLFRPKQPLCGPKIPNPPKPPMDGPNPPKPPLDGPYPPKPPLDGPNPPKPPLDGPKPPKPPLDGSEHPKDLNSQAPKTTTK